MTESVRLTIDLSDCPEPERVNERIKTGAVELDWSRVRDAQTVALVPLLSGLDLSKDGDALGLDTESG